MLSRAKLLKKDINGQRKGKDDDNVIRDTDFQHNKYIVIITSVLVTKTKRDSARI